MKCNTQLLFEHIFAFIVCRLRHYHQRMRIIILFALCRYAHVCAFISVIELPRIPAYCPKAKPANKAKAPEQTKPSGRRKSLDDEKSSVQNAAPDNTKLMTDPSAAPGKTKSSSTSSKIHPDISKDSDKETLYQEVLALREKNEQLEQTISWMHDLIWELTRRLHITQSR